jgi:hypothetical protein
LTLLQKLRQSEFGQLPCFHSPPSALMSSTPLSNEIEGKKLNQKQLPTLPANMQTWLSSLDVCSGTHFLGRTLLE